MSNKINDLNENRGSPCGQEMPGRGKFFHRILLEDDPRHRGGGGKKKAPRDFFARRSFD
jgi:hypothetical protein